MGSEPAKAGRSLSTPLARYAAIPETTISHAAPDRIGAGLAAEDAAGLRAKEEAISLPCLATVSSEAGASVAVVVQPPATEGCKQETEVTASA